MNNEVFTQKGCPPRDSVMLLLPLRICIADAAILLLCPRGIRVSILIRLENNSPALSNYL